MTEKKKTPNAPGSREPSKAAAVFLGGGNILVHHPNWGPLVTLVMRQFIESLEGAYYSSFL